MTAMLSVVEIHCKAQEWRVRRYLNKNPSFQLWAGGENPLRIGHLMDGDFPIFSRRWFWFMERQIELEQARRGLTAIRGVGNIFLLVVDPEPRFRIRLTWRLQLVGAFQMTGIVLPGRINQPCVIG